MSESAAAIRADGLTRHFGTNKAVDSLSLQVPAAGIYGLVGPDGSGKTTVMRLLAGILAPTAGDASVLGHSVAREPEAVKEKIGYMGQKFGLYPDLTVAENIGFYAELFGVPEPSRTVRAAELLGFGGLTPFRRRLAADLSGGMKQKLSLACAVIHAPKLLLLDEPTSGVDPLSRREFWRMLYQLVRERVTIVISTAYLDEAERCGRVALMDRGRLLAAGTPTEIKRLSTGTMLELLVSEPRRAVGILRLQPSVRSANLFGTRLHAVIASAGDADGIATVLEEGGIELRELRTIEPSLEDVFVSVATTAGEGNDGRH